MEWQVILQVAWIRLGSLQIEGIASEMTVMSALWMLHIRGGNIFVLNA